MKKGPLALASGPSLGRKRPRRAAIAQGATAPQQYAIAAHKAQAFLTIFPCKYACLAEQNRAKQRKFPLFFNVRSPRPCEAVFNDLRKRRSEPAALKVVIAGRARQPQADPKAATSPPK
jgi:hypothetical protein